MQDFKSLHVWQKSHAVTLQIYEATRNFPESERFGITAQIRRASASIGANIAEGCCRQSDAEFNRFLFIALGSTAETENFILLSSDLGLLSDGMADELLSQLSEVRKMLIAFTRRLQSDSARHTGSG